MSNLIQNTELTEEQKNTIKAIDDKVKLDVDALPKDKSWNSKMFEIVRKANEDKLLILNKKLV